jgi:hypothetical protein
MASEVRSMAESTRLVSLYTFGSVAYENSFALDIGCLGVNQMFVTSYRFIPVKILQGTLTLQVNLADHRYILTGLGWRSG